MKIDALLYFMGAGGTVTCRLITFFRGMQKRLSFLVLTGTPLLVSSLLWQADTKAYFKKPPLFRAPSWSWAALDGSLDFADMHFHKLALIMHP
jgi:hypothetical protein